MLQRRQFMKVFSAAGLGGTLLPGVLWAEAHDKPAITAEMIDAAAKIAGVAIPDEYRKMMLESLNDHVAGFEAIFQLHMPNSVQPSLLFFPDTSRAKFDTEKLPVRMSEAPAIAVSKNQDESAFATVRELAELVRTKKISSGSLTEMYLERLKRYDAKLKFTITLTEERALSQAKEDDREIGAGKYRGPLHGLPWGAKDLLAVRGYPTTWGAGGFEKQVIDEDATVVKRLDQAGAILVAKLTLGALANGDHWFGGITRNPWNPKQGSSGSSAGPASATAAGCVAFTIGSETLGSISSPSTRCGTTGYRPTFGFVPRTGAMALAWTMDKLGPICRSGGDCALGIQAIYGPDDSDLTVHPAPFSWDAKFDWRSLKIGYARGAFEPPKMQDTPPDDASPEELKQWEDQKDDRAGARTRAEYDRQYDVAGLERLKKMGIDLQQVELPDFPVDAIANLLNAEAAAAFDDLTLSGRDALLTEQGSGGCA